MPRGQPDFGMYAAKEVGATLSDMADLAVRLGSIVEYDRRGDVIYLDGYETAVPHFRNYSSDDCSAKLDSTYVRSGAQSVKLSTDGTINNYAGLIYYMAPMVTGKHGIKISPNLYDMMPWWNSYYQIDFATWDKGYFKAGGVRLNLKTQEASYLGADDEYHPFETDLKVYAGIPEIFHNIKLVYDIDAAKYIRLMINTITWDLSAYSFRKELVEMGVEHQITFRIVDLVGHAFTIWQDDFVYTINES